MALTARPIRPARGFTLIEMLVVIGILGVLAAITIPVLFRAQQKSWETQCLNNQRQLGLLLLTQAQDGEERLPAEEAWPLQSLDRKALVCPAHATPSGVSYVYNTRVAGLPLDSFFAPERTLLVADGESLDQRARTDDDLVFPHRRSTLLATFVDGHAAPFRRSAISIWYPGDPLHSIEEVKTRFGFDIVLPAVSSAEEQARLDFTLDLILRELSLYSAAMLRGQPGGTRAGQPLIDRLELVWKPLSCHPYQSDIITSQNTHGSEAGHFLFTPTGPALYMMVLWKVAYDTVTSLKGNTFHVTDYRVNLHYVLFLAMREWGGLQIDEAAWMAMNPPGFSYLNKARHCNYSPRNSDRNRGFMTVDGQNNPVQDQGSIYEVLLVDPAYATARVEYDPLLRKKVATLQAACLEYHPAMSEEFWRFLAKVNAPVDGKEYIDPDHHYIDPNSGLERRFWPYTPKEQEP